MLDHMMTIEQAARFATAKGCTAKPSATGYSLDFFDATGKLIRTMDEHKLDMLILALGIGAVELREGE